MDLFVSYAREDSAFAQKLAHDLNTDGVVTWIDSKDIRTGEPWDQVVERALTECSAVLVVLSPDATDSRSVMDEIAFALERGKVVLPVLYRACRVPLQIARMQYADFTASYANGFAAVRRSLVTVTPTRSLQSPMERIAEPQLAPSSLSLQRSRSRPRLKMLLGLVAFGSALVIATLVATNRASWPTSEASMVNRTVLPAATDSHRTGVHSVDLLAIEHDTLSWSGLYLGITRAEVEARLGRQIAVAKDDDAPRCGSYFSRLPWEGRMISIQWSSVMSTATAQSLFVPFTGAERQSDETEMISNLRKRLPVLVGGYNSAGQLNPRFLVRRDRETEAVLLKWDGDEKSAFIAFIDCID